MRCVYWGVPRKNRRYLANQSVSFSELQQGFGAMGLCFCLGLSRVAIAGV